MFQSFKNNKYKLNKLWNQTTENEVNSDRINKEEINVHPVTIIKKTRELILDFDTMYYDLYDFLGITYQGGGSSPQPESAYIEDRPNHWYFKYPSHSFKVPQGEKPEDITGTSAEDWNYVKTIGSIKQTYHFELFPDWAIPYIKIKTYIYSIDDIGIPVEIEDLSTFHRWIKKEPGYDFEFHGFFTLPEEQELLLQVSLVGLNKGVMNAIQGNQIQS